MKNGMRKVAKEEVREHESRMHKGKKGVKKFGHGGKTGSDMLKYGRGMAKVMNQRGR